MARGRGRRGGITGRELLSYARPRTADESLTDLTSNGDMPRGRGGITRRVGLSYATNGTTNEILDDSTSNGDMPRGRGGNTRKEGLLNAPQGIRDGIVSDSTSNEGGRKQLSVVNGFLENSSQCSRVITKIFKEIIDDGAFTWRKVQQDTKNFYFEEFKKHYIWEPVTETQVRTAWESKASKRYTDFLRDIRRKMIKPIFISEDTWASFVAYWDTPEYKGKRETNSQNRLKGDGPSTHTGGSVSYREYAKKLETTLKRPPNPFKLFVRVNESSLYYEAVGGVKKRNVYGLGSQAFAYYPNPASRSSKTYMPHVPLENKYLEMERKLTRKIGKQQQILELLCSHLDIPVPSTESDTKDNNEADTIGGTQNPNTSNSEEHEVHKATRHDPSSDGVRDLVTASGRSRLNEDLESST
ncbi:PDR ABC-type transporter family protein [Tanacetum coccineum]